MSDKPKPHKLLVIDEAALPKDSPLKNGAVHILILSEFIGPLSPDDAVALGYALFEHGLYLKGRMRSGEQRTEIADKAARDQVDANGQRGNGDGGKNESGDDERLVHGETPEK